MDTEWSIHNPYSTDGSEMEATNPQASNLPPVASGSQVGSMGALTVSNDDNPQFPAEISGRGSEMRVETQKILNSARLQNPSFFQQASGFQVRDSEFSSVQGDRYGSLNIVINQGSASRSLQDRILTESTTNAGKELSDTMFPRSAIPYAKPNFFQEEAPSSEIYRRQLLPRKHGYPLWIPSPNTQLSDEYRRTGASVGDVGIITSDGGWDYLFNIRLSAKDPRNPPQLPEGFVPLQPDLSPTDIYKTKYHSKNAHIASSSVCNVEKSEDLIFRCTEKEGAILVMPEGADREDLLNLEAFQEYIMQHAESWYVFVNGIRGRRAENSSLHVVTGCDKTLCWGMAIYSNFYSADPTANSLLFKFKLSGPDSSSDVSRSRRGLQHTWELAGPALTEAKTGPELDEDETDLRLARRKGQERALVKNQCTFLRTYAVTLKTEQWDEVHAKLRRNPKPPSSQGQIPVSEPPSWFLLDVISYYLKHRIISALYVWLAYLTSRRTGEASENDPLPTPVATKRYMHPSHALNQILLDENPTAKIAITHDSDWYDLIHDGDVDMPPPVVLRDRMHGQYGDFDDSEKIILSRRKRPRLPPPDCVQAEGGKEKVEEEVKKPEELDPSIALHDAGVFSWNEYRRTGVLQYLGESLSSHKSALELRASGHPLRCESLVHLARIGLWRKAKEVEVPDMSEETLSHIWEACQICPVGDPFLPVSFAILARLLEDSSDCRDLEDSQEANTSISLSQWTQQTTRLPWNLKLSQMALLRPPKTVERGKTLLDAILYGYDALHACHPTHPLLSICYDSLTKMLDLHYAKTQDICVFLAFVEVYRKLWPFIQHKECPPWLSELTPAIRLRSSSSTCNVVQLNQTIPTLRSAVREIPLSAFRLGCLEALYDLTCEVYLRSGRRSHFQRAIKVYSWRKDLHFASFLRSHSQTLSHGVSLSHTAMLSKSVDHSSLRDSALQKCRGLLEDGGISDDTRLRIIRTLELCVVILFNITLSGADILADVRNADKGDNDLRLIQTNNNFMKALRQLETSSSSDDIELHLGILLCLSSIDDIFREGYCWEVFPVRQVDYEQAALALSAQYKDDKSRKGFPPNFVQRVHEKIARLHASYSGETYA